jgi:AraC family transcriptional regulator
VSAEDPLALRKLLATPLVDAYDARCAAHQHERGDEEDVSVPTLVFPRRGLFRWEVGKRSVVADPNTALLFHPARSFTISHPAYGGDDCVSLRIAYDVVEDALGAQGETPRFWTLPAAAQRALHASLHKLGDPADALQGEEIAVEILALLSAAPARKIERDEAAVETVRERIAADPAEHLTLGELARDVGLSPFHLARRFRTSVGSSIHEYRTRLRLLTALNRLHEGADEIAPLALDLGFASHGHFSGAFRRMFGVRPTDVSPSRLQPLLPD